MAQIKRVAAEKLETKEVEAYVLEKPEQSRRMLFFITHSPCGVRLDLSFAAASDSRERRAGENSFDVSIYFAKEEPEWEPLKKFIEKSFADIDRKLYSQQQQQE